MSYQETSSQLCTDRQIYIKTFQLAFQHLLIVLCSYAAGFLKKRKKNVSPAISNNPSQYISIVISI